MYSSEARDNLKEIFHYISEDNPLIGELVLERIERAVRILGDFPYIGTPLGDDMRMLVEKEYRYRIYYRVMPDESIFILGISKYKNTWS